MPLRLPPLRFSLLGLMALVAYVAMGCAALRYATPLLASSVFTLAVGLMMIAVLGIVLRRDQIRAGWIGFLVFGGGYLLITCGPWPQGNAHLLTNYGLAWLESKLHGETPQEVPLAWTVSGNTAYAGSPYIDLGIDRGVTPNLAFTSSMLVADRLTLWDAASGRSLNPATQSPFTRIGHALFSPLIGLIGVLLASWLYAGRKPGAESGTSAVKQISSCPV